MYEGKRVVICSPDMIAEKYGIKVKKGYAPMAVFDNLNKDDQSFGRIYYSKT